MKLSIRPVTKPSNNAPFVLFVFEKASLDAQPLVAFLNAEEKAYIRKLQKSGAVKEKDVRVVIMPATERKVIMVGCGDAKTFTAQKAGLMMRIAVQMMRKEKVISFAFSALALANAETATQATSEFFEVVAANAVMANFEFVKYKTKRADGPVFLEKIEVVVSKAGSDMAEGLRWGVIIGEEVNACRELANTPGGDMTPEVLAAHAIAIAKQAGVKATILDEKKIKALGMGGVMGVAKGSDAPPRFIILEYYGVGKGAAGKNEKNSSEKPVVLVGKGVTFDTGGLNLKPSEHIYEMHMDMSGGAAVIHAVIAAARLKLRKNIIALVPAVENMPSGSSYRPGDVLRTMGGKTIEVLNTDAEGRVILADALEYAKRYNPELVVDVATLTGAAWVALGTRYSALFATSKALEDRFRAIGEATGDLVWPLPLSADYEDDIRGTFGDWANTQTNKAAGGGAIAGAVFLWQFTKNGSSGGSAYPWVHLDIAPRMTSIEGEYLAKGAAGAPVRLLVRLLEG